MELTVEQIASGITKINLRGRMDILGVQAIDVKFTALTATQKAFVLVDLAEVSFLASLGLRTLISSAKALAMRGGNMVLASPQANVREVLDMAGVSELIPVFETVVEGASALAELQSQ